MRARGGWLADAAYAATLIRVLPTMVDHKVEGAKQGAPEEHEVGFLHCHMVGIVGNMEDNEEGRWAPLCTSGTQLGTTFFAAWENVRDAAGNPDTGPLSDEPEHAGRKFQPKEAMRWGGENASAPGPEDPDDKVKEQKQITMEIEYHLDVHLKESFKALRRDDMRRVAMFSVGATSRSWLYTPPYPGCELSGDEFAIISCRYYGCADTVLAPHVGTQFQRKGSGKKSVTVDRYGVTLANANVGGDRWRLRHDGVLKAIMQEFRLASQEVKDNVYNLFIGKFGERNAESERRAAAFLDHMVGIGDKKRRRRQGLLPDFLLEMASAVSARVGGASASPRTLFELKQLNCVQAYYLKKIAVTELHAVEDRAKRVHPDYCRSLHEVDKEAGTKCAAPRLASGKCSYGANGWDDSRHNKGGGERYLVSEFGTVQPLVFGHFGEINSRFQTLIDELAEVVANLHHREHGWRSAKAGICRAREGIMRRVSMAVLRETARHITRGLEIVGPQCVQKRVARRARSSAAEADMDEFRAGIHNDRGFGNNFRSEQGP